MASSDNIGEPEMSKSYVIHWKSKINGRAGKGTKLFERSEAEQLVQELNREYPDIEHHLLDVEAPSPDSAPHAPAPEPEISEKAEPPVETRSASLSFGE
jgi:hypothetical protein